MKAIWAALAAMAACSSVLGVEEGVSPGDLEPGMVFYTSNSSGTVEIWAVPDQGGSPVRITHGMTEHADEELNAPTPSWDGTFVVVAALRNESYEHEHDRFLWRLDPDGSDLRFLGQATTDTYFYGLSWSGDSKSVIYADANDCTHALRTVEVATGSHSLLFDGGKLVWPAVNPTMPSELLVFERSDCGTSGSVRRLDLDSGQHQPVPGVPQQSTRFRGVRWNRNGDLFVAGARNQISVHDLSREYILYTDEDPTSQFGWPTFGNGDARVYAKWCSGAGVCDIAAIDVSTGQKTLLGVPNVMFDAETDVRVGWAPVTGDIDSDGDGLANGIDPD